MKNLINTINSLKEEEVRDLIESRIQEFSLMKKEEIEEIFKELCFCIMTANCSAKSCIEIHEKIDEGFLNLNEQQLSQKFKDLGYRFPNIRANYIIQSRKKITELEEIFESLKGDDLRNWIVKNIKGLGYKESSHFLRNIGYNDYAIIDFHIVDLLEKNDLVERPKTMTKKRYLEIEEILKDLGEKLNLTMAELDLYLWYLETGTVLK